MSRNAGADDASETPLERDSHCVCLRTWLIVVRHQTPPDLMGRWGLGEFGGYGKGIGKVWVWYE